MNWEIIIKAGKEPLRLFVLALIPGLLAYFGTINSEWAIAITFFLRFLDKALHELGKAEVDGKGSILTKGLTRF